MSSRRGTLEAKRHGIKRSDKWPKVEKAHLQKQPACLVCGSKVNLQVHHIFPFHYAIALGRPDLELDDRNLITLCEVAGKDHHLLVGHLDNFKSSNLNVLEDVKKYKNLSQITIENNVQWSKEESGRLKPLNEMTAKDKQAFKTLMNKTFPRQKQCQN